MMEKAESKRSFSSLSIYLLIALGIFIILDLWQPIWFVPPLMTFTPWLYLFFIFLCIPVIGIYGYLHRFRVDSIGQALLTGVIVAAMWLLIMGSRNAVALFLFWDNVNLRLSCNYSGETPSEYSCQRSIKICAEANCARIIKYDFKRIDSLPFAVLIDTEEIGK